MAELTSPLVFSPLRFWKALTALFVPFPAAVTPIETADAENPLVGAVFVEKLLAEGEEVVAGDGVLKQNDAFFLLFEEPLDGGGNHPGLAQMIVLP